MRSQQCVAFSIVYALVYLATGSPEVIAENESGTLRLDLPTALARALRDNPDLMVKRQALGIAQGRIQQAELFFQENPHLSMDVNYRHRRFASPLGRHGVDTEVRLLQEIEIAGQRDHRREAATKNLTQVEWEIADAERLLHLEVTRVFHDLLVLQEKIVIQRQVLSTQEALFQAGSTRFAREDISVLDADTLRLDRDRAQSDLLSQEEERMSKEQQMRLLLGMGEEAPLAVNGEIFGLSSEAGKAEQISPLATLEACAVAQRPDVKVARLSQEIREAELRLAQARSVPNISVGPLYKLDNEDQVIGGAIVVPLPFFHRTQQEITTALTNRETSRMELSARERIVRQEVSGALARLHLARQRLAPYGKPSLANIAHSVELTRKAYEAGEITIFELSVALERLVQTRFRFLDALLTYLHARVDLESRLTPACLGGMGSGS
jgi:cobalt-zinc-cadmium efflux system outer membrane protein